VAIVGLRVPPKLHSIIVRNRGSTGVLAAPEAITLNLHGLVAPLRFASRTGRGEKDVRYWGIILLAGAGFDPNRSSAG
jgi:hypothetical protein